jgi:hypothetical protein
VPPAVALLNYISSGILWRIFAKLGHFAGFSLRAGGISAAAMAGTIIFFKPRCSSGRLHWAHTVLFRGLFSILFARRFSEAAMVGAEVWEHKMINMTIRELFCTFADFFTKLQFTRDFLYIILISPKGTAKQGGKVGSGGHYIF